MPAPRPAPHHESARPQPRSGGAFVCAHIGAGTQTPMTCTGGGPVRDPSSRGRLQGGGRAGDPDHRPATLDFVTQSGARPDSSPTRFGVGSSSAPFSAERGAANPPHSTMFHVHDIDTWRAAIAMVQHYGPHALERAHSHLDDLRRAGNAIGVAVWGTIVRAIAELTRARRDGEPLN
jgi:hypothetical protein